MVRSHHLWFLIITTIRHFAAGGGEFSNVGIVLTAHVGDYFPLRQSYAGFQLIVYPSSMSIVVER